MAKKVDTSSELERLRATVAGLERQISEHKQVSQQLAASTAKTNAILDAAVDGILTIDEAGTIESVNPAVARIFGYRPHEIIGHNVKALMPEPYSGEHDGYLEHYRRTGERRIIGIGRDVQGLRRDGTVFPLELAVSEGFDGARRFFTGIVRDLSERDEARKAQASLAAILEDSLNEMFVFHADTLCFLQVNRGARENLGFTMSELNKRTPVDIKPEMSSQQFQELLSPLRSGDEKRLHFETIHERKDGTRYPVDVHLQLGTYGGQPAFIALIFDMTERNQTREDLRRTERRAVEAEKLASIATLTAGIAHDVGTPMNVILGYANMLENSLTDEKDRKRAHVIAEQTQRVTDLIQTLLNISRPHEPNRVRIDLSVTLEHGLQFFREKLKKRGIKVERQFAEAHPVLGESDQLERVFLNLFVNAADAMSSGGTLSVQLRMLDTDWVEILIRDSGAGIAPHDLERIFDPFFTTKERGKGNGLGLVVSKGIIVEHGGTIEAESTLGEGTEIRITLPSADRAS